MNEQRSLARQWRLMNATLLEHELRIPLAPVRSGADDLFLLVQSQPSDLIRGFFARPPTRGARLKAQTCFQGKRLQAWLRFLACRQMRPKELILAFVPRNERAALFCTAVATCECNIA